MNETNLCRTCGNELTGRRAYNWEGELWCAECLRALPVEAAVNDDDLREMFSPLPWEHPGAPFRLRDFFSCWWLICRHPVRFFLRLSPTGSAARSLWYVLLVAVVAGLLATPGNLLATPWVYNIIHHFAAQTLSQVPTQQLQDINLPATADFPGALTAADAGYALGYQSLLIAMQTVCTGILLHLCLIILGENLPFEMVQRIQRYAAGAAIALVLPSLLGAFAWPFFQLALVGIGLHVCFGIRIAKAFIASGLSIMLFFLLFLLVLLNVVGANLTQTG